jgi:hypothetical protein
MFPDQNSELVAQLRQLQVQLPDLDRDRLLYQAGQRSVKKSLVWPAVSGLCLMLALSSFLLRPPFEQLMNEQSVQLAIESKPEKQPESSTEPFPSDESLKYMNALQDLIENKPWQSAAKYDSLKSETILTAGSYLQWFRQ